MCGVDVKRRTFSPYQTLMAGSGLKLAKAIPSSLIRRRMSNLVHFKQLTLAILENPLSTFEFVNGVVQNVFTILFYSIVREYFFPQI